MHECLKPFIINYTASNQKWKYEDLFGEHGYLENPIILMDLDKMSLLSSLKLCVTSSPMRFLDNS